eukprot:767471-Hanusia_phi.AAC.7
MRTCEPTGGGGYEDTRAQVGSAIMADRQQGKEVKGRGATQQEDEKGGKEQEQERRRGREEGEVGGEERRGQVRVKGKRIRLYLHGAHVG